MALREANSNNLDELARVHCQAWCYAEEQVIIKPEELDQNIDASLVVVEDYFEDENLFILLHENGQHLRALFVEPSSMEQGIGMGLLKSAEEYVAFSQGKEMLLHVVKENEAAQKFYENRGYILDSLRLKELEKDTSAVVPYKKDLRPKKYKR